MPYFGSPAGRATPRGRRCPISRAADSALSLPWIRFSVNSMPRSPLIVPGAALRGLVAPIMSRTTFQVSSGPSMAARTTGPRDMKVTSSA